MNVIYQVLRPLFTLEVICMHGVFLFPSFFTLISKGFMSSSITSSYNSRFLLTNATYFLIVQTDSSCMVCVTSWSAVPGRPWPIFSCDSSPASVLFVNLHSFLFPSISYIRQLVLKFTTNPYSCRKSAPINNDSASWPETRKTCSKQSSPIKNGIYTCFLFSGSYCSPAPAAKRGNKHRALQL